MKKYLMAAVALICMTVLCVSITSCSKDNDDDVFVRYDAVPGGSNLFSQMVCDEMNREIATAFGSSTAYRRDDSKAIRICDAVAEKVRDNSLVGTIQLTVTFATSDPNANSNTNLIKTYQFPF